MARRIILLDLNSTLSGNMGKVMANSSRPFASRIKHVEEYRQWLVEWLKMIDWEVHLFTVRDVRYREVTLESIHEKTGWSPDDAWFNDTAVGGERAHVVKSILLDRVLRECGGMLHPPELFSFESNTATLAMLRTRGVRHLRILKPGDLPPLAGFRDDGLSPAIPEVPNRSSPQIPLI